MSDELLDDPDELRRLYIIEELSQRALAERLGRRLQTVRERLGEYEIPRRKRGNSTEYKLTEPRQKRAVDALRHAASRHGGALTREAYDELGLTPSAQTISDALGSWEVALTVAGLRHRLPTGSGGHYSDTELLGAVVYVAERDGTDGPLTQTRYDELRLPDEPSAQTIINRFGGFVAARELAFGDGSEE